MTREVFKIQNLTSEMLKPASTETDATLAVSSAAVSFSASDLASSCKYVRLQVQDAPVRITYDGSAPTALNGELVQPGQMVMYNRDVVLAMKFIRQIATDAVIWAQPFNCRVQ